MSTEPQNAVLVLSFEKIRNSLSVIPVLDHTFRKMLDGVILSHFSSKRNYYEISFLKHNTNGQNEI